VRSLPFPRRLQLVKLLRAHGLRDVERLREDELREALARLHILMDDSSLATAAAAQDPPWSAVTRDHQAGPPPPVEDDSDDPHAHPRFREPRISLPNNTRTFLRTICVKPGHVFCTWELDHVPTEPVVLSLYAREFLGEPPAPSALLNLPPFASVTVDAGAAGWYLTIPAERMALTATLAVGGHQIAVSNMALTPPSRPAPPGPLWMATLDVDLDRRKLLAGALLRGHAGVHVEALGSVTASGDTASAIGSSGWRVRGAGGGAEGPLSSSALGGAPSSHTLSSHSLSSHTLAQAPSSLAGRPQ
jgi:hypothetical protein